MASEQKDEKYEISAAAINNMKNPVKVKTLTKPVKLYKPVQHLGGYVPKKPQRSRTTPLIWRRVIWWIGESKGPLDITFSFLNFSFCFHFFWKLKIEFLFDNYFHFLVFKKMKTEKQNSKITLLNF